MPLKPHVNNYTIGRGEIFFGELDANNNIIGERFLGNCPSAEVTVTTEKAEHTSSTSGLAEVDDTTVISVAYSIALQIDDPDDDNLALFLAGSSATVTQSATPVVDESFATVKSNREYQLGRTTSNPTGVRDVSSVTVESLEGHDASAAATTTEYELGDFVQPATPNNRYYMCVVAGESGGSAPTWPTDGSTVTDGTVTWRDMGPILRVVTTDYTVDADAGRFYVVPGGGLATAIGHADAIGVTLGLYVGYTPAANTRTRVATGSTGSLTGAFIYKAKNAKGASKDYFIAKANWAPEGAMPLITAGDYQAFGVTVSASKKDNSTSLLYVDGQPAD